MTVVWFVLTFMAGACFGLVATALCVAASERDRGME